MEPNQDLVSQVWNLLAGKSGTAAAVLGWIASFRLTCKWWAPKLKAWMEDAIDKVVATDSKEDDALVARLLSSRIYRTLALVIDLLFSIKLPTKIGDSEMNSKSSGSVVGVGILFLSIGLLGLSACRSVNPTTGESEYDAAKTQQVEDAIKPVLASAVRRVIVAEPKTAKYFAQAAETFVDARDGGAWTPELIAAKLNAAAQAEGWFDTKDEWVQMALDVKNLALSLYGIAYGNRFKMDLKEGDFMFHLTSVMADALTQGVIEAGQPITIKLMIQTEAGKSSLKPGAKVEIMQDGSASFSPRSNDSIMEGNIVIRDSLFVPNIVTQPLVNDLDVWLDPKIVNESIAIIDLSAAAIDEWK